MTASITAHIGKEHYQVTLQAGEHFIIADEPESVGGKDAGFNPAQLLLSGLGACTSATLRMYADKKGMALTEAKIHLTLQRDEANNTTNIKRSIELAGDLTDEEKEKLLVIAEKCIMHKILTNPITIDTELLNSVSTNEVI